MAVDVNSFTDTDIINGTLSHTVTITPATEITSVTYSVENSTLSNEVSVDAVGFTAEDTESGTEVTLKPHILRHEVASTGSADIVMTITDKYGRSVNVTDSVTIMNLKVVNSTSAPNFKALNMASTADGLNPSAYYPSICSSITPKGYVNGVETNILSYFKGPAVDTSNIVRAEFVNDGEFEVTTTLPSQCVPNMVDTGNIYTRTTTLNANFVFVPIATLSNYIPTTWDEVSIFDNMTNANTFKFKPNDTYLKLYTYNDGWDDRDYIIYTNDGSSRTVSMESSSWSGNTSGTGSLSSGLTGTVLDTTQFTTGSAAAYAGAYLIPRYTENKIKYQGTKYNESDYGVTYSSSNASNNVKTIGTAVYMYATDLANLASSGEGVIKDRSWMFAINPELTTTGVATKSEMGMRISGTTTLTMA